MGLETWERVMMEGEVSRWRQILYTIMSSWLLRIGFFGIGLLVLGYVIRDGTVAGMIPVYGILLVIVGFGLYACFKYLDTFILTIKGRR